MTTTTSQSRVSADPIDGTEGVDVLQGNSIRRTTTRSIASLTPFAGTLTQNALVVGEAAGVAGSLASLGTATTLLHGNASGPPAFSAVALATDVSGILPTANGGNGTATPQDSLHFSPGANTAAVANGTYVLKGYMPYAGTITSAQAVVGPAATGSFTAEATINGTPVTGINAVTVNSATVQSFAATGANTFAVGALIAVVIASATSSPVGGWVDLIITKA